MVIIMPIDGWSHVTNISGPPLSKIGRGDGLWRDVRHFPLMFSLLLTQSKRCDRIVVISLHLMFHIEFFFFHSISDANTRAFWFFCTLLHAITLPHISFQFGLVSFSVLLIAWPPALLILIACLEDLQSFKSHHSLAFSIPLPPSEWQSFWTSTSLKIRAQTCTHTHNTCLVFILLHLTEQGVKTTTTTTKKTPTRSK